MFEQGNSKEKEWSLLYLPLPDVVDSYGPQILLANNFLWTQSNLNLKILRRLILVTFYG